MTRLAVIVPSRGRPGNLLRLVTTCADTVASDYRVYSRLDDDDPTLDDYLTPDFLTFPRVTLSVGPRIRYAASTNELVKQAYEEGATHFALLGDDVLPETRGWDRLLIDALGGRNGVAYGSDGLEHKHGPDLPTHVMIPAQMYELLGWLALPTLRHLFMDNVWRELGRAVDNFQYVPEAKLTHLHPWAGLSERDQTYAEANDARERSKDRDAFEAWVHSPEGLAQARKRLRG